MSHGLILFPRSTPSGCDSAFRWWIDAAASFGLKVRVEFFENIILKVCGDRTEAMLAGGEILAPQFVVMRGYCTPLSEFFEHRGVRVVNSTRSMSVSRDKLLTHLTLSAAGLPQPATIWCPVALPYADAARLMSAPRFVIKEREGSKGEKVWLADSEHSFSKAISACSEGILLQEYVEESHGRDLRIWVIGGEAVAAVIRKSGSDFRSNFALGGSATLCDAPPEARKLAEKAAAACGLFFAGVDLLFTRRGFTVCEVNGNAGFRTLSKAGGPDILNLFFKKINDYRQISDGSR